MNGKILISTHKEISKYPKTEPYMPVYAGSAITNKPFQYQRDDENHGGGEISSLNPTYLELTALYWGWKNLKNYDYLGLCHYSKWLTAKRKKRSWPFYQCFAFSQDKTVKLALTKEEIEKILQTHDGIVKKETKIRTRFMSEPLGRIEAVIKQKYPEYLSSFYGVIKSQRYSTQNIFVMRKRMLDDYLTFMYSFCEEGEKIYGDKFRPAFATEHLLSIWLDYHKEYSVKKLYTIASLGEKLNRVWKLIKIRTRNWKKYFLR
ncbi:MAG: DUF4422 domain-containing protein [Synergistaceae bacterium]|jgi:hypothetical protein|nr:DUF4422 domain-containing protein [Synergistaceae bacterium]